MKSTNTSIVKLFCYNVGTNRQTYRQTDKQKNLHIATIRIYGACLGSPHAVTNDATN